MEINHVQKGKNTIISMKGRLDTATGTEAENAIKKILDKGCQRIVFDLSELEYLSSGGLRVILKVSKEIKRKEGKFVLCSLNELVKEVFVVGGFGALIPIVDTVDSGIKQLEDK